MPQVRYQIPGVPAGPARGMSAFTPGLTPQASGGAQRYKYNVVSLLGRGAVPAPTLNTQIQPDEGDKAQMGTARSSDAPQAWWPQKSYQDVIEERPGAGMPIGYYSPQYPGLTTLLPVPATGMRGAYQRDSARLARRAILNRVRQLPWFPRTYRAPDG